MPVRPKLRVKACGSGTGRWAKLGSVLLVALRDCMISASIQNGGVCPVVEGETFALSRHLAMGTLQSCLISFIDH